MATDDCRTRVRGRGRTPPPSVPPPLRREREAPPRPTPAAGFLQRMHAHVGDVGVEVRRVLTDNGSAYFSRDWKAATTGPRVGRPPHLVVNNVLGTAASGPGLQGSQRARQERSAPDPWEAHRDASVRAWSSGPPRRRNAGAHPND